MTLPPGTFCLVNYGEVGPVWHQRLVLSHVNLHLYIIATPDFDIYEEEMHEDNVDFVGGFRIAPDHRPPLGINIGHIYGFAPLTDAEKNQLFAEGFLRANAARALLGLPPHAAGGQAGAIIGGAAGGAAVVPAPPGGGAPAGPQPGPNPPAAANSGGLAALAAAIGAPVGGALPGGPGGAGGAAPAGPADDARVLPVMFDVEGKRFREFRDAVNILQASTFADWPVKGPRTTLWCLRYVLEHGGTLLSHHARWKTEAKLQATDYGVQQHELLCRILTSMLQYDQLDLCNLASAELAFRELQLIEQKHYDRLLPAKGQERPGDFSSAGEHLLFLGSSQSQVMVCPALKEWLAEQMKGEAMIMKEMRKAREERALLRGPKPKEGKD